MFNSFQRLFNLTNKSAVLIFTDLHAVLLEDLLVLLQKQDDKYVLKCQSMSAKGHQDNKVSNSYFFYSITGPV